MNIHRLITFVHHAPKFLQFLVRLAHLLAVTLENDHKKRILCQLLTSDEVTKSSSESEMTKRMYFPYMLGSEASFFGDKIRCISN